MVIKVALSFLPEAEPGPLPEHAATALHGRSGIVERAAHAREGEAAEEERVTQQDQREKCGPAPRSFRPLQHAGGQPVAGEQRELREVRFHQETVQHGQHARLEHFVGNRLGFQPPRGNDEHEYRQGNRSHLKGAAVQIARHVHGQPRARDRRQDDEKRDQYHRGRIEMPRHMVRQTVSGQQRRDEEEECPRRQQRRFHQFPAKNNLRRQGQRQQKSRFTVLEEVGIVDDQIAEQEEHEQKSEQKKHQSFNQQRAESREIRNESQSLAKQPEGQHGVADDEKDDQRGEKV